MHKASMHEVHPRNLTHWQIKSTAQLFRHQRQIPLALLRRPLGIAARTGVDPNRVPAPNR